jgi:hypothetical protein
MLNDVKYIGLDVHQATISAAVLDFSGKLLMECILETKAATILQFVNGLCGSVQDLGRRNLRGVGARSARAARHESRRVRSSQECPAEVWKQE